MLFRPWFRTSFQREVDFSSYQRGRQTYPSHTAQQRPYEPGKRNLSMTSPHVRIKPEPEKGLLLLGVQKLKVPDVFDFLEPPPWLSDMKINSPPSNGPDDKELITLIKAINRQMKSGKTSFKKSNSLPVPITLSFEIYADDLFNNPGEESQPMRGVRS